MDSKETRFLQETGFLAVPSLVVRAITELTFKPRKLYLRACLGRRWLAILVPLLAMFLGDVFLEVTTSLHWQTGWLAGSIGFHRGMLVIYGTVALIAALGMVLRNRVSVLSVAAMSFAAAEVF